MSDQKTGRSALTEEAEHLISTAHNVPDVNGRLMRLGVGALLMIAANLLVVATAIRESRQ